MTLAIKQNLDGFVKNTWDLTKSATWILSPNTQKLKKQRRKGYEKYLENQRGNRKTRMLKFKQFVTVAVCFMLFTGGASAKTMYLKNSAWSYTDKKMADEDMMSVYGKGESVEVLKTITVPKARWEPSLFSYWFQKEMHKVCLIEKNGLRTYIQAKKLTEKKPADTYTISNCYRKLTIRAGGKVYDRPKGTATVLKDSLTVYTIGQTKLWYEFYDKGNVYFIRKNAKDITSDTKASFPKVILDGVPKSCIDRVKYQYSIMPETLRKATQARIIVVSDWKNEDKTLAGFMCPAKGLFSVNISISETLISVSFHLKISTPFGFSTRKHSANPCRRSS